LTQAPWWFFQKPALQPPNGDVGAGEGDGEGLGVREGEGEAVAVCLQALVPAVGALCFSG
jgi:hypothetical protein